ncbi:hypothetical protein ACQ4PT_043804 [Festuca glaucescens]
MYADDVVTIVRLTKLDLLACASTMEDFGVASGLCTNLAKCSLHSICCQLEQVELARSILGCEVASFPIKYLGLPIGLRKVMAAQLQPMVDSAASRLQPWCAKLLNRGGRTILVQTNLCMIPIHVMMSLDIPSKVLEAFRKIGRAFMWKGRQEFCADRKKPRLKVGTHPIWESFFEANLADKDTNSVTSSINGILERLGQKEGGAAMTLDQITRVLEDLQCTTSTDDPEAFTFDLRKMVEACRNEEIESLVKKKYGQEAFTIFRLLVTQGCPVETDRIIDTTILDKQIVHSTLYKLWKDDYTDSEKITSAPGTGYAQFFVWRAKNTFREQFIDILYHAALNLRQVVNYIAELLLEVIF